MSTPQPTAVPDRRASGRHVRRRRSVLAARSVVAVVSLITLLVVGLEWQIEHRAEVGLRANSVHALVPADPTPTSAAVSTSSASGGAAISTSSTRPTPTPVAVTTPTTRAVTYQSENILLLGADSRAGANSFVGTDSSTDGVSNSDVVMVAHISADRQHVSVLSIPRDTMIPAPTTCHAWNATTGAVSATIYPVDPGQRFHFNAGYSVGGPQCTVTEVQALTGLHIDRYIGIDFAGFQTMVDALGGVQVDMCAPVIDSVLGTVIANAGVQEIHGAQALGLVRARHVTGDTASDLARIKRQQVVLSAILRQVTAAGTLLNPNRLDNFLQAFVHNTSTDNVTLQDLVNLAGSLDNLNPGAVNFYTLPTYPSTITPGALEVSQAAANNLFAALRNDQVPVTAPPPASKPRTTSAARTTAAPTSALTSSTSSSTTSTSSSVESVNAGNAGCAGPGND